MNANTGTDPNWWIGRLSFRLLEYWGLFRYSRSCASLRGYILETQKTSKRCIYKSLL